MYLGIRKRSSEREWSKKSVHGLLPISLERTLKNFWGPFVVNETAANPPFEQGWGVFGTKGPDQKFFSVSGMGFGQQPLEPRGATFPELSGYFGSGGELGQQTKGH
jgi:hypothetical protein